MQIDYIRRNTPESFSEDGGAYIQIVNKKTTGLSASIEEARTSLHVVGSAELIEGYFVGLMRSVFEGIREDGHPRTVGDISFFPVCGGQFDLDKGWDPAANDVRIKARLLNGVTLDITDWTFRDVTEGRVAFMIDTVSDGTVEGCVSPQSDTEINCRNLPDKEKLTVSWTCGAKSGTVAANKITGNVARLTVDKSAFSALTAEDHGKDITLTVKGCYNKATKTATVRYVGPTPIYTSTLGGTKIYTAVDDHGNALPAGPIQSLTSSDKMVMTGVIKQTQDVDPGTGISHVNLKNVGTEDIELMASYDMPNGKVTLQLGACLTEVTAGTYANAKLAFTCYKDGQPDTLEIPLTLIKG